MISFMYNLDYKDEQHTDLQPANITIGQNMDEEVGEIIDTVGMADDEDAYEPEDDIYEDGKPGPEGSQPALCSSVRVYAIADKYDIPPLKELAKQRFSNWAETNWDCVEFPAMVKEIFESTLSTDRGLREVVFDLVTKHADVLLRKEDFQVVIEGIGELGLGILLQLVGLHSEEKSELKSQIESLESRQPLLEVQLIECQQSLADKRKELTATINRINDLYRCRNCGHIFHMEVESSRVGSAATIRCCKCRTRH
jgi:hypothetical protein